MGKVKRPIRILLIQPPVTGGVVSLLPQVGDDSEGIGFKPPIGLLYLATTAKEWGGHDVKIVDAVALKAKLNQVVQEAIEFQPELIGITAWTDFWWSGYTLGRMLKEALPQVHLCYGGPHVSIYPQEILSLPFVDSVVLGDGELPFLALGNMIANHSLRDDVPGLHFKKTGLKNKSQAFHAQHDLDQLPLPDRRLLNQELYTSVLGKQEKITTMITSRGCPGRCVFCKLYFQKTICRSAESVITEFQQIQDLGIKEVEVYDDTFTWSRKRVVDICDGLINSGNLVSWAIRDRVDRADPYLLELLRQAGCNRVHYGVESGVDRILKIMRKGITTNQARQAVRWAKEVGMTVVTYFMFGNLGEDLDDMKRTIDFALELDSDYAEFSITIPYPGTELYNQALERAIIPWDYWRQYALQPIPDFQLPRIIEEYVDLASLVRVRNHAIRKFYFRPRYLWRQSISLGSFREFMRKFRMGCRLLRALL